MSNSESSKINIDAARDVLTQWTTAVSNFSSSKVKASSEAFFTTLQGVGLDNGFASSYDQNNNALESALNSSRSSILSALDNMYDLDDSVMRELQELLGLEPTGNGGSGGGSGQRDSDGYTPTGDNLVDNSKEQLELYKNMSMSDLNAVASELIKLAKDNNITLDQLLNGEEYSSKIHSALLLSQHIPEDMKLLIEDGKTNISQKLLQNIFTGANPELVGLTDNTTLTVKKYLTMVANSNNTTLEQLLSDEQYTKTLTESLGTFSGVTSYIGNLKKESITESLLSVYDGTPQENMTSGGMSIMRDYIDQVAQSNNTDAETMLTGTNNMVSDLTGLGKTSIFMNTMSAFNPKEAGSIISSLLQVKESN